MSEAKAAIKLRASKKLNVKKLCGDVKAAILEGGGKPRQMSEDGTREVRPADWVELIRVVGRITGFRSGQTQFGPWISYTGDDLAAINSITGEVFKGKEILIPEEGNILLQDPVKAAVLAGSYVQVALAVEAQLTPTIVGYQYRVTPLMPVEVVSSESLQLLIQYGGTKAQQALLALAAPAGSGARDEPEAGDDKPEAVQLPEAGDDKPEAVPEKKGKTKAKA